MTQRVLENGLPLFVPGDDDRIGAGPWARWVASAVVSDESSPRAERGRELARIGAVSGVTVTEGSVAGSVASSSGGSYEVRLDAQLVPRHVWTQIVADARRNPTLAGGVEGTAQSVHLAHRLETRHDEPLVPISRRIRRSCTCPDAERSPVCKHAAALAFVLADAIDDDPSLLLLWRGCPPARAPVSRDVDPWASAPLPLPRLPRALPAGAVVQRLGRSGIRVGDDDLADALAPAYRAFASLARDLR